MRNFLYALSHEWVRSTTHRRAFFDGSFFFISISSPRRLIWGIYPRLLHSSLTFWLSYPLSPHRCCECRSFVFLGEIAILSRVAVNSFTSCTCAPSTTCDSGIPQASTRRLRLVPFFPPIRRIWTNRFNCKRRFYHAAIDALPSPRYAFHLIIFCQAGFPEPFKKTGSNPFSKISMNSATASVLSFRYCLPLNTRPQNKYDSFKNSPCGNRLASSSRVAHILSISGSLFSLRDKR